MPTTNIIDNLYHGNVRDFYTAALVAGSDASFCSAFFTIHAYAELQKQLEGLKRLRFLFGEPTFIKKMNEKIMQQNFHITDENIVPARSLQQQSIAKECSEFLRQKAEIRSIVKPNFLHGKLYHIIQPNEVQKTLIGSSNFTVNGLGVGTQHNIELNLIVDSNRERRELLEWFNEIWDDQTGLVEDVKDQVLEYLQLLYKDNSPEFIYFKTLFHIFEEFIKEQQEHGLFEENAGFFQTQIWNILYPFQQDGVRGAINKIMKHNGCIIADSVGLGKTYEALAIIKYFELRNDKVLVVCPKKLNNNWTLYQAGQDNLYNPLPQDRFGYRVLWHTDIGRSGGISQANGINLDTFHWGAFDLVVIDESHNFRGNPHGKELDDGSEKLNRVKFLLDKMINAGAKTKVLLLSATPVNNTLRDLRNQIYLITGQNDRAFDDLCGVKSIEQTMKTAQEKFTKWANPQNKGHKTKTLFDDLNSGFFKLLDELTIARSRKHIRNFYGTTIQFPTRLKPVSKYPAVDTQDHFPTYGQLDKQIQQYKLSIFNPSAYVKEIFKSIYENKAGMEGLNWTQAQRETTLIGMMKVNFLKRLESSIYSFTETIKRTIDKIENIEMKIKEYRRNGRKTTTDNKDTPDTADIPDYQDDDYWKIGKKLQFDFAHLDLERWAKDLAIDRKALHSVYISAKEITPGRDEKLQMLKQLIADKQNHPINANNRKVLIFTAFADTARYLYENINNWANQEFGIHTARVCGSDVATTCGKKEYDAILTNFSPRSKKRGTDDSEIDILIATDCISEGQNLQDCDYCINYDIHWNPVRVIQRFGRIDRLGSENDQIQLVNFWPTQDLDEYINLKTRVETKMTLVDLAATGQENILVDAQLEDLIDDDLKFRTKQLKKLQDEVIDLEEMDESVSLTDFTLTDFRVGLQDFLKEKEDVLRDSPLGLFAVVPHKIQTSAAIPQDAIRPGVIFCLRQKIDNKPQMADGKNDAHKTVNPLSPIFLVYIYEDGTVRYNFSHAKQILEVFQLLCLGKNEPCEELCVLFQQETNQGKNMDVYDNLLQSALASINETFTDRNVQNLMNSRSGILIPDCELPVSGDGQSEFELLTWLIIK